MARAASDPRSLTLDETEIQLAVRTFLENKKIADEATKRMKTVQPMVVDWLQEQDADPDGNHEVELPEPIAGYVRLNLVRVVKTGVDFDAVERIVKERGLPQCLKVVTVPDEEEIAKAAISGDLTDEDMAEMFPQAVSHRLMTPKK
mgnify:FL=1